MSCKYNPLVPTSTIPDPKQWCNVIQGYCQFQNQSLNEIKNDLSTVTYERQRSYIGTNIQYGSIKNMGPKNVNLTWKISDNLDKLSNLSSYSNYIIKNVDISRYDDLSLHNTESVQALKQTVADAKSWYDTLLPSINTDITRKNHYSNVPGFQLKLSEYLGFNDQIIFKSISFQIHESQYGGQIDKTTYLICEDESGNRIESINNVYIENFNQLLTYEFNNVLNPNQLYKFILYSVENNIRTTVQSFTSIAVNNEQIFLNKYPSACVLTKDLSKTGEHVWTPVITQITYSYDIETTSIKSSIDFQLSTVLSADTSYTIYKPNSLRTKITALNRFHTDDGHNVHAALLRRFGIDDPVKNLNNILDNFILWPESLQISPDKQSFRYQGSLWDGDFTSDKTIWWIGTHGISCDITIEMWNSSNNTTNEYYKLCPILDAYINYDSAWVESNKDKNGITYIDNIKIESDNENTLSAQILDIKI